MNQNPFIISGYISPEYFCDREEETARMLNAIENGRHITLFSPRRMGKTGLIRHLFYQSCEKEEIHSRLPRHNGNHISSRIF